MPSAPVPPVSVQRTNVFAIISLIGAFFFPVVGIVFGHLARAQIRRTGEEGAGLAIAGLVLGYIFTIFFVLLVILWLVLSLTPAGGR